MVKHTAYWTNVIQIRFELESSDLKDVQVICYVIDEWAKWFMIDYLFAIIAPHFTKFLNVSVF